MKTSAQTRTPSCATLTLRGSIASRAVLGMHAYRTGHLCFVDTRS
ncbi:MAG: hypothetical protein AAFN13_14230 [Bacteroidota bacterium]